MKIGNMLEGYLFLEYDFIQVGVRVCGTKMYLYTWFSVDNDLRRTHGQGRVSQA